MLHNNPNAFCANPLDRVGVRRKDADWLADQAKDPKARLLVLYKGEPLLEQEPTRAVIQWLTLDALSALPMDRETVLLGLWDGEPIYATDVSSADDAPLTDIGTYLPVRTAAAFLPPTELSVVAQAVWLLDWHRRNRYCAKNGDFTEAAEGGFKRINPRTGVEHFPRTDPVAIVLPYHEGSVCLGRGPHFPQGFMSAFAGYLEPGETLEQCGERELFEEVGLRAQTMDYHFSQPWPFPSSLMMGFTAQVEEKELTLDPDEIEEAAWFTRAELVDIINGDHDIMCPPPFAIAHQLMKRWLEQTGG
ncbi:MAG: NAD(+) diphosphatase [Pseudomonadota bacterium]